MAPPKVLSAKDLKSGSLLRSGAGKKKDSSTRLSKTNIGKGTPSPFQNPDFAVPTIQLGLPNQNELQKAESKLSKTQKRLSTTSIGKSTKIVDPSGKNIIGSDIFNNDDPFGNDGLNQNFPEFARDSVKHGTLKVKGMSNRSKSTAATRGELPTLSAMLKTDNFSNKQFNAKSRGRFINPFNAGGGLYKKDEDGGYKFVDNRVKINTKPASTRSGYKVRTTAATKLRKAVGGLDQLSKAGIGVNTNIFTPSGISRSQIATDKAFGNVQRPSITSPYGNYANPKFGKLSKSVAKTPSFTQSQFSQNIKLLSAGYGLGNTKAREAISAASRASAARVKKANQAKNISARARLGSDPVLAEANRILKEQGADYKYEIKSRRRRRGRYETYVAAVYTGPTITKYRTWSSSRGRQKRIRDVTSPGTIVSRPSYTSVVQNYQKNQGILDFAQEHTDIKPTGKYYDPSLNVSKITSRINQLESMARRRKTTTRNVRVPYKRWVNGKGYRTGTKTVRKQTTTIGTGSVSAAGGKLTQAQANEYAQLISQRSKAGGIGKAAFAKHVESVAQTKKSQVDQYVEPLDNIYSYAAVGDDTIGELESYYGDLSKAHSDYDKNIDILTQGIAKVQTVRGKASAIRKGTSILGRHESIEAREQPYDTVIADTSAQLTSIGNQLSGKRTAMKTRGNLAMTLNSIMGTSEPYSLQEADQAITNKIPAAEKAVTDAEANYKSAISARVRGGRSAMRARERRTRAAFARVSNAKAYLSKLKTAKTNIATHGADTWGTDKINSGVIATPSNRTITGARTGKNNWYRGAPGSTVLKIPKDKIPASGKVIVEATVSYTSGYKGRTHATGTFGTINKGSKTVRQELPVDANGNVKINMHMYGTKYGQQAKAGISNIKVIDPTRTQSGATLLGDIGSLTSQQSQLQSTLKENQATKSYFDNAQAFLGGKTNTLKGPKGKTIATFSRGKLNITDQERFTDVYGTKLTDSDTFGVARAMGAPISALDTRISSIQKELKPGQSSEPQYAEKTARLSNLTNTRDFLTGKTNKLVLGENHLDDAITSVKSAAAKDIATLSSRLAKQKASQNRNKNSYGFKRYTKNKGAVYASWAKSNKSLQDQITARTKKRDDTVKKLQDAKTGKSTVTAATRGQLGKIDVKYDSVFSGMGIDIPKELLKDKATPLSTKHLSTLETSLKEKEAKQKALVGELKVVQKERIKETATAQSKQIDKLVGARVLNRREAAKQKADIAKQVRAQTKQIDAVSDNVPIPDIEAIDPDLKSEAQRIFESTESVIKASSKAKARQKLRQVTRSRKPATSPVGAVLKVGAVVPRPRPAIKRQTTSLGSRQTSLPNPFLSQ
jgi:hypothetical protein